MMKGKSVITPIMVLAVLCAAPVATQAGLVKFNDFAITGRSFDKDTFETKLDNPEKWVNYRLADWNDIVSFVDNDLSMAWAFSNFVKTGTGYDSDPDALGLEIWVASGGYGTWFDEDLQDTRHYFARVPGEWHSLQDGFEEHAPGLDTLSDGQIVLGSWKADWRHGLLINKSVEVSTVPVPAAVWLFGTALIGLIGFGKRRKAA